VDNDELPRIPCPVCQNCDHDLRGDVLNLSENIADNLKQAFESLLDGMEADGPGEDEFADAIQQFSSLRRQITEVIAVISDVAHIKAALS
jgi:hypothetical protein